MEEEVEEVEESRGAERSSGADGAPVIVVGVDGSDPSTAVLRWAAEEARLRGGTLKVVSICHLPSSPYVAAPFSVEEVEASTLEVADRQITAVLGSCPDLVVTREVRTGVPAQELLEAATGADLVVVGSRGRGGFSGLLLGSVSAQVAHHARCPVTIVRG